MRLPTIIFDMSGVLIDFDLDAIKKKVAENSSRTRNQVYDTWKDEKYIESELGLISSQDFYCYYSKAVGLHWSYDEWIGEWSKICSYNENGINLFNFFLEEGFRVHILSNLAEYHKKAVELKYPGFWERTHSNLFSYELNLLKPDTAIFHSACRIIRKAPSECYFFDDTPQNVISARGTGMCTFHFTDAKYKLILERLYQLGIHHKNYSSNSVC